MKNDLMVDSRGRSILRAQMPITFRPPMAEAISPARPCWLAPCTTGSQDKEVDGGFIRADRMSEPHAILLDATD